MQYVLPFATGLVSFAVLDGIWLGFIMRSTYARHFSVINGAPIAFNWVAAALTYVLMVSILLLFAVSKSSSLSSTLLYGALLGLAMYGVYDFTNMATLKAWTWQITIVDIAWGMIACGLTAGAMKWIE